MIITYVLSIPVDDMIITYVLIIPADDMTTGSACQRSGQLDQIPF
jgi:hypothetical protein